MTPCWWLGLRAHMLLKGLPYNSRVSQVALFVIFKGLLFYYFVRFVFIYSSLLLGNPLLNSDNIRIFIFTPGKLITLAILHINEILILAVIFCVNSLREIIFTQLKAERSLHVDCVSV